MEVHGTGWLWHANDWAITGAEGQSRTDTGLPHRFLSLVRSVLSYANRHDYVRLLQSYRLDIYA